jgi:hypothetical protein
MVVLAVLIALPASGTFCAMLCGSAAASRSAAHHGSGTGCDEQATLSPSSVTQLRGASGHDCGEHDAATRPATSATASGPDGLTVRMLPAATPVPSTDRNPSDPDSPPDGHTFHGRTPRTASPLVLRV